MPPQSKNQPPACVALREALRELKEKQAEFRSALDQGRTTGDLKPAQALKAEIEQKIASLKERLWPFKELPQPELEKQYQTQKEIFQKTGILERLSNGELGIKGIDDQEYLKAIQKEPIYAYEQGITPEDQLAYAILHLEQTDQVIDDWQGNGSLSYQLGAYFISGKVPSASWDRVSWRANLRGYGPRTAALTTAVFVPG